MKSMFRWILPLLVAIALFIPGWVFFDERGGLNFVSAQPDFTSMAGVVFPLAGLYAFTLLWLQLMIGSLMPWLKQIFRGIERWHRTQGVFVFLFALTHPTLLVIAIGVDRYLAKDFVSQSLTPFVVVGQTALFFLTLTVLTALLRKVSWVKRWWRLIHVLNYVTFALVWFHSWNLGGDVQSTGLRVVWLAYGVTFIAAVLLRLLGRTWPLRYTLVPPVALIATEPPSVVPNQAPMGNDGFMRVAGLDQINESEPFCANVNGKKIVLFRFGQKVYALQNACNHQDGSLCDGMLEGNIIECPLHFSRFDVTTGGLIDGPATKPQPTFPVEVRGADVFVKI